MIVIKGSWVLWVWLHRFKGPGTSLYLRLGLSCMYIFQGISGYEVLEPLWPT